MKHTNALNVTVNCDRHRQAAWENWPAFRPLSARGLRLHGSLHFNSSFITYVDLFLMHYSRDNTLFREGYSSWKHAKVFDKPNKTRQRLKSNWLCIPKWTYWYRYKLNTRTLRPNDWYVSAFVLCIHFVRNKFNRSSLHCLQFCPIEQSSRGNEKRIQLIKKFSFLWGRS